jgi:hypothetical protein
MNEMEKWRWKVLREMREKIVVVVCFVFRAIVSDIIAL